MIINSISTSCAFEKIYVIKITMFLPPNPCAYSTSMQTLVKISRERRRNRRKKVGVRIRMTTIESEQFLMIECGNLAALTLCHPKMQIQDQQRQLSISQWCCAHHLRAAFCAHALWTGVQQQAQAQVHKRVSTSTPVYKTLARAKKSPVRPN